MAVIDAAATPGVLANTSMQSPSMKLQSITDQRGWFLRKWSTMMIYSKGVAQLNRWIWLNTSPCTSTSTTKMPSRFKISILIASLYLLLLYFSFTARIAIGLDAVLRSTHNLYSLFHQSVVDDAYVAQVTEIC